MHVRESQVSMQTLNYLPKACESIQHSKLFQHGVKFTSHSHFFMKMNWTVVVLGVEKEELEPLKKLPYRFCKQTFRNTKTSM